MLFWRRSMPWQGVSMPSRASRRRSPSSAGRSTTSAASASATRLRRARGCREPRLQVAGLDERVAERVEREIADHFEALATRLERIEHGFDAVAALEDRLALATVVAELGSYLEALTHRTTLDDPGERLLEVSTRIDRDARDGIDRVNGRASIAGGNGSGPSRRGVGRDRGPCGDRTRSAPGSTSSSGFAMPTRGRHGSRVSSSRHV